MRRVLAPLLVVLLAGACSRKGLDKSDVVDGLVARDFTKQQATCIADRIFEEYSGSRRQKLVDDLEGDIPAADREVLTAIVDACLPD